VDPKACFPDPDSGFDVKFGSVMLSKAELFSQLHLYLSWKNYINFRKLKICSFKVVNLQMLRNFKLEKRLISDLDPNPEPKLQHCP
jgi:hypothetical protein